MRLKNPASWLVLGACALGWMPPATAATSCLNDNLAKLCLDLSSEPGDSVQPSGLGGTDTFVKYAATFRNAGQTSTRNVLLRFQLSTAAGFDSYVADPNLGCSLSGGTVTCVIDKFEAFRNYSVTLLALPPPYTGASTPATMVNTGTYGWNGNTRSTVQSIAVSKNSGRSYVPANTTVTLVTGPEAADPSQQVTPESPLFARITLPPRPYAYFAAVSVITDGPNNAADCPGGLYLGNGVPYVCRDTATPTRWILTQLPDDAFTADDPIDVVMFWDASIVPALQLPPNAVAKTGLPPFAIFHNQTEVGVPYGKTRAFANECDAVTPVAPCLYSVAQLGSGDWTAHFVKPNDGSDMAQPLVSLARVLEAIVNSATAAGISLGPIMK